VVKLILFSYTKYTDQPWDPPILLYYGYQVSFLEVKQLGHGIGFPPPFRAEVKE